MATHSTILAWRIPQAEEFWQATVHGVTEELDMTEHAPNYSINYNLKGYFSIFKVFCLSCVQPFITQWTVARQAPLSMEFSRQE